MKNIVLDPISSHLVTCVLVEVDKVLKSAGPDEYVDLRKAMHDLSTLALNRIIGMQVDTGEVKP